MLPQFPSLEILRRLPQDEVLWRRLLLEDLPANTRALEKIEQHLAFLIEILLRQGAAPATINGAGTLPTGAPVAGAPVIAEPLVGEPVVGSPVVAEPVVGGTLPVAGPLVTIENLVIAALSTPTVTVGTESEFELEFKDFLNNAIKFDQLSVTEVDIAAPDLVNADDVRLRLFRQGRRRVPLDLVAEFSGSSVTSGTWQASFSNRRIEYTDENHRSRLYIAIRNKAGNSGPTTFQLRFTARSSPRTEER